MTVEDFVQSTVAGPGALSKEAIAFRERQTAEAETALREAKKGAASAEAKVASIVKRHEAVNARLVEVTAALRDRAGVRAVAADLKALKAEVSRRSPLAAEQAVLAEVLQLLVGEDLASAELAAKEARIGVKRAQRDWADAKGREEAANLWAALAPAMRRDPALTIQMDRGGVVVEYVKKIAELDSEIDQMRAALARETGVMRQASAGAHNTN
jgi:hypothetical protein